MPETRRVKQNIGRALPPLYRAPSLFSPRRPGRLGIAPDSSSDQRAPGDKSKNAREKRRKAGSGHVFHLGRLIARRHFHLGKHVRSKKSAAAAHRNPITTRRRDASAGRLERIGEMRDGDGERERERRLTCIARPFTTPAHDIPFPCPGTC